MLTAEIAISAASKPSVDTLPVYRVCGRGALLTLPLGTDIVERVVRHLFVCTNQLSSGKPACGGRGGQAIVEAVQRLLIARGATDALVTPCGCLGPCFDGPNAVVYPDGVWYAGLDTADAPGLVRHLVDGSPLTAKRTTPPGR